MPPTRIILFDGVCNLCNGWVKFVIRHDPQATFRFAALQSEAGARFLTQFNLNTVDFQTFIFIEGAQAYQRSTAALRVLKALGGIGSLAYLFIIIPRPIRDFIYNWVAKNRYQWFGKSDSCLMPTAENKQRFLA